MYYIPKMKQWIESTDIQKWLIFKEALVKYMTDPPIVCSPHKCHQCALRIQIDTFTGSSLYYICQFFADRHKVTKPQVIALMLEMQVITNEEALEFLL